MSIKVYNCTVGSCYEVVQQFGKPVDPPRYVGQYLGMKTRSRDSSAGSAGQSLAPIFVFEKETIDDTYPPEMMREVECRSGGKRKNRKSRKQTRRKQRKTRRN